MVKTPQSLCALARLIMASSALALLETGTQHRWSTTAKERCHLSCHQPERLSAQIANDATCNIERVLKLLLHEYSFSDERYNRELSLTTTIQCQQAESGVPDTPGSTRKPVWTQPNKYAASHLLHNIQLLLRL